MNPAWVVVADLAVYGPFESFDQAKAWASHPNRTADVTGGWRIAPLFGGAALDDEPEPEPDEPSCPCGCGLDRPIARALDALLDWVGRP